MKRIIGIAAAVVSIGILAGTASAGIVQRVLVSDRNNDRVLEFGLDGSYVGVFASGYVPGGIAQDSAYNVYIADSSGGGDIKKYQTDGTEFTSAFTNSNSNITPDDLAFDASGNLYFGNPFGSGDEDDGVYRVDTPSSATEVLDDSNFDGPPRGITFDGNGNLLVADRGTVDGQGELESFDPDSSFSSNAALITDEPNIEAPIYHDGSVFYTVNVGSDGNDPAYPGSDQILFVVREINATTGDIIATYDPDIDTGALLLDTIIMPDGDLLVSGFVDDAVYRYDATDGWSTFASGDFGGVTMDGPSFMSVIIPEPTTLALLGLGFASLLGRRRRRA
mgnify:FL=1